MKWHCIWTAPYMWLSPFLALVICFFSNDVFAIVGAAVVTPSSPGFNPAGGAANNSYGVYESLSKTASTGRVGYPSIPVANRSSMAKGASNAAMRGIWRAGGYAAAAMALVYAGGEFLNYLQCSTNQICRPGQGAQTDPAGSNPAGKYCADYSTYGDGFCGAFPVSACASMYGADSYRTDSGTYGYCYYAGFGGIKRYISKIANGCPAGYGWSGSACVNMAGTDPVPASDSDLERAADAYRVNQPARYLSDLKTAGKWVPDQNTMTAPQPDVAGAPLVRELPEDKPGAPPGNKIEQLTPHTAAKPAADAQSVTVYNYDTTVVSHTDGSTSTSSNAPTSNFDIPDDYAREATLDAIRKALVDRTAAPGDDSCSAAPQCSGDAIGCAILAEQYKSRCALRNEQVPDQVPNSPEQKDLNQLVGTLDQGRWSGAAVCPPDIVANVGGHQIVVSMDRPCAQAAFIRPAVIAFGLLLAAMVIMRVE